MQVPVINTKRPNEIIYISDHLTKNSSWMAKNNLQALEVSDNAKRANGQKLPFQDQPIINIQDAMFVKELQTENNRLKTENDELSNGYRKLNVENQSLFSENSILKNEIKMLTVSSQENATENLSNKIIFSKIESGTEIKQKRKYIKRKKKKESNINQ